MGHGLQSVAMILAAATVIATMAGCTSEPRGSEDGPPPDTAAIVAAVGGTRPTTRLATQPFVAGILREAKLAADAVTDYPAARGAIGRGRRPNRSGQRRRRVRNGRPVRPAR